MLEEFKNIVAQIEEFKKVYKKENLPEELIHEFESMIGGLTEGYRKLAKGLLLVHNKDFEQVIGLDDINTTIEMYKNVIAEEIPTVKPEDYDNIDIMIGAALSLDEILGLSVYKNLIKNGLVEVLEAYDIIKPDIELTGLIKHIKEKIK